MDGAGAEERGARLAVHLERRYGAGVSGVSRLSQDVFRVDRQAGVPWVARIFPPARSRAAVEGDAAILRRLQVAGFPAERCATPEPVSDLAGEAVLVTVFVGGRQLRDGRTFAALGTLLGRLHAATATTGPQLRAGGAWHHLAAGGGVEEELDAAEALLRELEQRLPPRERARSAGLRRQLRELDLAGLPQALLHPDFVPANAILTPADRHLLVDWAGAGRGPRVWSLGFLLFATGGRPRLVELVASRYARQVRLNEGELERLADAILERALVFGAWSAAHRGRPLAEVEADADAARRLARRIAAQARQAWAGQAAEPRPAARSRAATPTPPPEGSPDQLPLPALLSQAWVAWTIELDDAYELVTPHRTTRDPGGRGPWLTSSAMWWNCLRHLAASGSMTVEALERRSRLATNLAGMERWGYLEIQRPRAAPATWTLALTPAGRRAASLWEPLPAQIDERWRARFAETARLREALIELVARLDPALPDCLPMVGPGGAFLSPPPAGPAPDPPDHLAALPLGALLARVLSAYAREAERGTRAGLPFLENLLRLLDSHGVPVRELPARSGVSKEAQQMALGLLERGGLGEVVSDPEGSRFKLVRLTPRGVRAWDAHAARLREVEGRWAGRARGVREVLAPLVASGRLLRGLRPPASGWRARVPRPAVLPRYPMVLHRGGYPDGS